MLSIVDFVPLRRGLTVSNVQRNSHKPPAGMGRNNEHPTELGLCVVFEFCVIKDFVQNTLAVV
jgi:hypothetical protein